MARKPDLKPNYSSSSDDEEEQEEQVSGSEDEQTSEEEVSVDSKSDSEPKPKDDPKKQPASKPQPTVPSSSETEEDSDSDSDSDSPLKSSAVADPNNKPISSTPIMEAGNVESKSAKKSIPPPLAKGKRPPPANENKKDAKKAKKSDDDSKKKQLFERVWSKEDEIILLKGMIECKTEDMGVVHDFVKNLLHFEVSKTQILNKLKKLKKKYVNNANKEKNGKKGFSNSHEQKGYELSKIIWGSETEESEKSQTKKNGAAGNATGGASTSTKKNGVGGKEGLVMEVENNMDVSQFVWYGGMSYSSPVMEEEIVKAGLELVDGAKKEELNEKWKKFKVQEMQLYVQRIGLIKERAEIVLEAMLNSSGN